MNSKYLVAIPVFNEARYVLSVLDATKAYAPDILVVDDGSTDATPELLGTVEDIAVVRHDANLGYGRSLADAFAYAERHGYAWLITMDCDEQHEPAAIPDFLAAIGEDNADVISGSRYCEALTGNDLPPEDRRTINRRITKLLNDRLGMNLTDAFCGFKAYRVASLGCLRITESGYAMPMQFWAQAAAAGLRVCELPVKLVYNDPTRHFGGALDDPEVRYRHYVDVFESQMRALRDRRSACSSQSATERRPHAPCRTHESADCIPL